MTILQEMVLLSEIVLQIKIAQRAAERLHVARDNFDQIEIWCSIQSILVASGNVSKVLWPQNKKYSTRGEKLRQMLHVEADNILSSRKFRNHFEHYDERIEEWFKESRSAVYTDLSMKPSLRTSLPSNDHRGYNAYNNTLVFRSEMLDLNEVLSALEAILCSCRPYVLT